MCGGADPAVQWPPRALWMDGLSGPVWLETGVCHLKMKARPINIIGEHLLLVTTRGEPERPPHPSATPEESGCGGLHPLAGGPVHPSLTPGMLDMGCMFGPGTCLPLPDQSRLWPIEEKMLQRTWKMPQGAHAFSGTDTPHTHTHTGQQAHTHTLHHQRTLLRYLTHPPPILDYSQGGRHGLNAWPFSGWWEMPGSSLAQKHTLTYPHTQDPIGLYDSWNLSPPFSASIPYRTPTPTPLRDHRNQYHATLHSKHTTQKNWWLKAAVHRCFCCYLFGSWLFFSLF